MGISNKSHGKKTDKETQSPLLKIFTEMVQKEKRDPEKTNLLNGKHVEKKRKHFLGYRSKPDQKSIESSSSDVQHTYKQQEQELRSTEYHRSQSQSLPFQGSKSWVFWQGDKDSSNNKKGRTTDDTCSCVSCALKKIIGNDYACVGCLALLFSISVIVACLLVYKCIPTIANTAPKRDSERLKRKIDSINGWGSFMPKTFGGFKKKRWHESSFRDLGMVDADSELSKIIDDTKLSEIQSSVRLRDFYKKLLKADSNIRKLKKSSDYSTFDTNLDLDLKSLPEREKRSINLFKKPLNFFHFKKQKSNKTKIQTNKANQTKIDKSRHKRQGNSTADTIIIEKDQVLIQYKPRIVPKCSHNIPKDVKAHEHLLKHPFYKNTQRLDELLDQFNRNLPEIINDQFGFNLHMDDKKSQCKHTKPSTGVIKNKITDKPKVNKLNNKEKVKINNYKTDYDMFRNMRNGNPNMEGAKTNGYADFDGDALKRDDLSTNNYDILLTISTILNQNEKRTTPYQDQMDRIPNLRRLLQIDGEDDESINYEDLKEVLTDDNQEHDDDDKQNRKKRLDDVNPNTLSPTKYHPPNVNNPNWKGPMPLYPDEINSMIKQEPVIVSNVSIPVHLDELKELSDLDYIEDYLDSTYKGLVKLAQAYSDYGVFSYKKSAITEKKSHKMTDKRTTVSPGASEGIRFEIQPTSTAREDKLNLYDFIHKHVKVTNNLYRKPTYVYPTITIPKIDYESKRFNNYEKNIFNSPLDNDKRSVKTLDKSNLHKVPLVYDNKPVSNNLKDVKLEIEKRNKKESRKKEIDKSKHGNNIDIVTETMNNFNEKVIIENDSNNDKIVFKKRSLKNFDITNITLLDDQINDENSDKKTDKIYLEDNKMTKTKVNEDLAKGNINVNLTKNSDMDLSDFFMMMSNIFSAMDREDVTTEPYNISNIKSNPPDLRTTDILYPMYDSDMVDNIGHRSRVLMSVNTTDGSLSKGGAVYDADAKKLVINVTNPILSTNRNLIKNKTARVVKRHAEDNTIFWNDIYDDEYGVKMDVFENIKDKNSATNEFVKRSNEWLQDKVRKISDNFHRSTTAVEDGKSERRIGRSVWNSHNNVNRRHSLYSDKNKLNRKIRNPEESPRNEGRITDFSALTVHMKDVCRRAASAVRESSENDDKKEEKTNAATTSMMQELVNLMTNLIDFQVQQRTCMKLPPDLHHFLDWLTDVTPSGNVDDTPSEKLYTNEQPEEIRDEKPSSDMPSERDDQDPRSDCLGTLQAIQDLLRSFEDMSDDDKSKMTGVKDYLLNQITYLKKRLADEEFNNNLQYHIDPYRSKRDLSKRRRHHKFMKNYSRKHTRTTASYYDGMTFSEPFEVMTRKKVKEKRNLRDIYYKALADAKKVTTIKNHH